MRPVRELVVGERLDKFGIDPDGVMARGVCVDDVVVAVGDLPISTRADLALAIASFPADRPVILRLRRAGAELSLTLTPPWRQFLRWIERECLVER